MNPKRWHPELFGLIVAAAASRLWAVFTPDAVVFDEVYFKAFAAHYLDGRYYFDIHPPLGKLLIAGFARLLHLSPDAMISGTALGLRILPAIAGALLVPLVWGILRRLGASRPFAFLGAFLILADNALLVESRFILMDSMLLLAGLSAVYFYLVARDNTTRLRWLWLSLAALSAGAAVSIKWTGLSALGLIGLLWLWDQHGRRAQIWRRLAELGLIVIIPALLYIGVFWAHFSLLPRTGDGDAFMSARFQQTLPGNYQYNSSTHMSFLEKFIELNREMYTANQTLTATHPYGSRWYTWPLEMRPIYYWEGSIDDHGDGGNIYLLGNPVIWWGVWLALIVGSILAVARGKSLRPATISALALAGAAYLMNLLPFVAVPRVMFLYHYFFSFIFSLIFVVMLWNDLAESAHPLRKTSHRWAYLAVLGVVAIGFWYFSPLSYGFPLSPADLSAHMWLHSWR